jgi:peptidoglycan L-alanyl-D-glutamate endopeptidase CwlK
MGKQLFYDEITLQRIELMHPSLREELKTQYLEINNMLPKGVRLRFSHTYRSFKEQNDLYAIGRIVKGTKVTNAKGGQSMHNYGLAFDIVILLDKDGNGTFETASFNIDENYKKVTQYFKSKGWEWGGDWKSFKDLPHFQKVNGQSISSLSKLSKFTDNGKEYPILK